jgi:hypothetical protein
MPRVKNARHFLFKHPLFRAKRTEKGIWYEKSVYYLWIQHLKQNTDYRRFHETQEGTPEIAKLYEDFGDVFGYDRDWFKTWWHAGGQDLFCEQIDLQRVERIEDEEALSDSPLILNLAIPITKNVAWLEKQVFRLLQAERKKMGVVGRGAPTSTARYPVFLKNPHTPALEKGLKVWVECRRRGDDSYIKVGQKLGLFKEGFRDKRRSDASKTQMIYRLKTQTQQIIDNTSNGEFPKHKARG